MLPKRGLRILAPLVLLALAGAPPPPAEAAGTEPFVVIAVVDTGINPYHAAFRGEPGVDYSRLVPGIPEATPLALSLDAASYEDALERDRALWEGVEEGRLYTIPGTRIVGAYRAAGGASAANTEADEIPIVDEDGHGTLSAALAAGDPYGTCPRCLLVVVEGFDGLGWATRQEWIDIVSNSWGTLGNAGFPVLGFERTPKWTRAGAERAQTILFASGNGMENAFVTPQSTWTSGATGPDWVVAVGAYRESAGERLTVLGTGKPVDVLGAGWNVPSADPFSLQGTASHSGTSAATPAVAGAFGRALLGAREALGDTAVGQRVVEGRWAAASGAPVAGSPALADGTLSRSELWDAVFATARPAGSRVGVYPATAPSTGTLVDPALQGYGAVDRETAARALDVLLGRAARPDRSDVEGFAAWDAYIRDALWGAWDRDGDGRRDRPAEPALFIP